MKTLVNLLMLMVPALLMQSCKKKDDSTDTAATTPILQAYINGNVWTPDTLSAAITYTAATGVKEFSFTGTKSQKRVITSVKQNDTNNSAFPLTTYKVDDTLTSPVAMSLYTQQLTSTGNYDFVLYGTAAEANAGSVTISAVDTVKKTITGTYSFTSSKLNYDENGNYVSITLGTITSGQFNAMPYTFKRN
ncbi:DUF6252 family protein [Mucilaginibacter sp. CSA2-8R]|uniref:DUF6252 family protein n=1 Tax=Mucilaginibacter sp. CSA2-8R TaxID=3141542 RepID=UPI00315DD42C